MIESSDASAPTSNAIGNSSAITQLEDSEDDTPIKYRSLQEVYDACSFAFAAPDRLYYDDAVQHEEWRVAMDEEISSIRKNQTWDLVQLPEGKNVVGPKWVFKSKYHAD